MRQFSKIMVVLLYTIVMVTVTMGQYHQVTESSVQSGTNTKTPSQEQETNSGINNDTKQCPNSADTMYQTTGPVNIYLHGGYASTDKDTQSSTSRECNCPPGPAGPKGDPGPQGPPGPTATPTTGNSTSPFTAFFAKMELQYGPYNEYRRVVFDHVITNIGYAYNRYKGVFTAPVDGVYQFHVHIHTIVKHKAEVKLRIGRVDVVSAWADSETVTGENHEMGSSNSLIVHLRRGQMVFCVLPKQQALAGLGFTSFSGYLLRTDDQIGYTAPAPTQDIYNTDDLMGLV